VAAGLAAFALGTTAESAIIRAVDGDRSKLEWISDVVLSAGVAGLTYTWLHLRASRIRLLALEREQIALDEQLRLAAEIQRSLLPTVPAATPGFRWAARMIPAGRIGGDFYDFVPLSAGSTFVILGDVSGKGIPAALILSSLRTLFRTYAQSTSDPAAVAERISAALYDGHKGMPYATAIVARFEGAPPRIVCVNAGHPYGHVLRDGGEHSLETGGPPLGMLPGVKYVAASLALEPGDVGVLVTDGITEALEGGRTTLGQVLRAARDRYLANGRVPGGICDDLLRAAAEGPGPAGVEGWQDDRTVFVFAVDGGP
jgi:sigma-B regulation protein RsbU (phosphoserine phosphatase)